VIQKREGLNQKLMLIIFHLTERRLGPT